MTWFSVFAEKFLTFFIVGFLAGVHFNVGMLVQYFKRYLATVGKTDGKGGNNA